MSHVNIKGPNSLITNDPLKALSRTTIEVLVTQADVNPLTEYDLKFGTTPTNACSDSCYSRFDITTLIRNITDGMEIRFPHDTDIPKVYGIIETYLDYCKHGDERLDVSKFPDSQKRFMEDCVSTLKILGTLIESLIAQRRLPQTSLKVDNESGLDVLLKQVQ